MRRRKSGKRILSVLLAAVLALAPVQAASAAEAGPMEKPETVTEQTGIPSEDQTGQEAAAEVTEENGAGEAQDKEEQTPGEETEPGKETEGEAKEEVPGTEEEPSREVPGTEEQPSGGTPGTDAEEPSGETPDTEKPSDETPDAEEPSAADGEEGGEPVEEPEVPAEETGEESDALFPGLGSRSAMSDQMLEEKSVLRTHSGDLEKLKEGEDYAPGEIIVSADSLEEAKLYAEAYNGTLKDYVDGMALIRLEADVMVAEAVEESAQSEALLPAAWPNYYRYAFGDIVYSDPFLDPGSAGYQYYHNTVGSNQAHRYGYTGEGVTVAVLDSGINAGHEELVGARAENNAITGMQDTTLPWTDNYGTADDGGHGTHVAGIIGAKSGNGKGGKGIAPDAGLLSIKVLDSTRGTVFDEIKGITKAIAMDADIINMSLGGAGYVELEKEACDLAYEKGVMVIAAAGNDSSSGLNYPAGFSSTVSVAALDANNARADFSNYGSSVNYCAPGVGIASAGHTASDAYVMMDGTSQASPVVAGTAAVLLSSSDSIKKMTKNKSRVDALRKLMDKGVTKATGSGIGKGYINLAKALKLPTSEAAPSVPVLSLAENTPKGNKGVITAASAELSIQTAEGVIVYYSTNGKNVTFKNGVISEGAVLYTGPVTLAGAASITVKAIAVDTYNGMASKQVSATYKFQPSAEKIEITSPQNRVGEDKVKYTQLRPKKSVQLALATTPSYAVKPKNVRWNVTGSGVTVTNKGKVSVTKDAQPGDYKVTAEYNGLTAEYLIKVVAPSADNPEITAITAKSKKTAVVSGGTTFIEIGVKKGKAVGNAKEEIAWFAASDEIAGAEAAEQDGKKGVQITGKNVGTTVITGVATDGSGKSISITVTVNQAGVQIVGKESINVASGKAVTLTATVNGAASKKVAWELDGDAPDGVKVSASGKVSVPASATSGSFTVKATAKDGSGASDTATVNIIANAATNISLAQNKVTIYRKTNIYGAPTTAEFPVTSDAGSNWTVSVDKTGIVSASKADGKVIVSATGKAVGKAKVTVSTTDGSNKKFVCTVTVENPVTRMYIAPEAGRTSILAEGKTLKLLASLENASGKLSAAGKKLTWSLVNEADEQYVSVNAAKGTVTGKKDSFDGTKFNPVEIKASTADGSAWAVYRFIVTDPISKLDLDFDDRNWLPDDADGTIYVPLLMDFNNGTNITINTPFDTQVGGNFISASTQWINYKMGENIYCDPFVVITPNFDVLKGQTISLWVSGPGEYMWKSAKITVKDMTGGKASCSATVRIMVSVQLVNGELKIVRQYVDIVK